LLTQHSVQRARRMLEDDGLKAVDIAKQLGFSTPAYFTRFIKTHASATTSELRNQAKAARLAAARQLTVWSNYLHSQSAFVF